MLKIEKNVPIPSKKSKMIVDTILSMEEGDSLFISYDEFNKTDVINGIANARTRIIANSLKIKSERQIDGTRIWIYKSNLKK